MRLSELLGSPCLDGSGRQIGTVWDLRVRHESAAGKKGFRVMAAVVGPAGIRSQMAHRWGYAEGRARGPALLRALTRRAIREARVIPAARVSDWGPGQLRIHGSAGDLPALQEGIEDE